MEEFLNQCQYVQQYDSTFDKGIYTVLAKNGFMSDFHKWNESNGIEWSFVKLPFNSVYVLYKALYVREDIL